jgi:FtsZ-binding cell division protein ZapB/phage tail protein X
MTRRHFAFLIAALLCAAPAGAVAFNDVRPGARAAGMGTAFGAIADDAFGMYYNPAGSANTPYVQAAGSLGRLDSPVGTLTHVSAAYLRPYEPINTATIGASYDLERQVNSGDMDTLMFNYAQEIKVLSVPLSKPLKIGGNFKFVNVDKGRGSGAGFGMGFDAGVLARTDMGLSVGAALTDLTSYAGVPRGGLLLATAYTWNRRITLAGDFRVKGGLAEYYPGIEATFLEGLLKIRAGRGLSLDGVSNVAFGLGVNFSPVVLDVAMSLPTAGINRHAGGYQASFAYRFGAPGFAGQFVGAAAAEAERLRHEVDNLEDRKKTLEQETASAETNRAAAASEVKVLEKRAVEAQDEYRALLKKNEEIDYRSNDKAAAQQPASAPLAVPKAVRRPPPPPSWPKQHIVRAGDTLRSLAAKYYGDPNLWEKIYDANPDAVDRGLPQEGAVLTIPSPKP